MTKKDVRILLSNAGIIKTQSVSADKIQEFDKEDIYQSKDGYNFVLEKSDLDQDDITAALLAKLVHNTKIIKGTCIFFVVLSIVSICLSLAAIL